MDERTRVMQETAQALADAFGFDVKLVGPDMPDKIFSKNDRNISENPAEPRIKKNKVELVSNEEAYRLGYDKGFNDGRFEGYRKGRESRRADVELADVLLKTDEKTLQEAFAMKQNKDTMILVLWGTEDHEKVLTEWNEYKARKELAVGDVVIHEKDGVGVIVTVYTNMSPHYGCAAVMFSSGKNIPAVPIDELTVTKEKIPEVRKMYDILQNIEKKRRES